MAPPAHNLIQLIMRTRAAYEIDSSPQVNEATYHPIELDYFAQQYSALSDADKAVVLTHLKREGEHSVLRRFLPDLGGFAQVQCARGMNKLAHDYIERYREKLNQPATLERKRLLVTELLAGLNTMMDEQALLVGGLLVNAHCVGQTTLGDIERFRSGLRSQLFDLYRKLGPTYFDTDEDGVYDDADPQPLDRSCSLDQDNDGVCVEGDSKPDDPRAWIDLTLGETVKKADSYLAVTALGGNRFLIETTLTVNAKKGMGAFVTKSFLQSLSQRVELVFARSLEHGPLQAILKVHFVAAGANDYADVSFVKSGRANMGNWDEPSLTDPGARAISHELGHWLGWEDYYYEPMVVDHTFNPGFEVIADQEKHWMQNHARFGVQIPQRDLKNFLAKVAAEGDKALKASADADAKTVITIFDSASPPSENQVVYSVAMLGLEKKHPQAIALAKRAYEYYHSLRMLKTYGRILIKAKQKPEAIALARKYYEQFPNAITFEYLSELLSEGRPNDALNLARRHCQLQPGAGSRAAYLELLAASRDKQALGLVLLKEQPFYLNKIAKEALFALPRSFADPRPWVKRISNYWARKAMHDPLDLEAYVDWARFLLEYNQAQEALDVMAKFADAQEFFERKDFIEDAVTIGGFLRRLASPLRKAAAQGLLVKEDLEDSNLWSTPTRQKLFRGVKRNVFKN
ncbi:MAG: hypothetical protein HYU97_03760 [Deltaproteobacteria bacterium]|nr:hypothetical protein [Deltaproteobacteria bacterium]